MIKLKKLVIKNFGSFKQEQSITFPENGLLLLHGSNGAGKSSFLKAIAYCLDFLDESASDFINWDNQEDIFVELTLSLNNVDLVIQRGNGFYRLQHGNTKTAGSDTPKKIEDLLVQPKFMSIMSYRGQGEDGNFSKLRPGEKQDFLSDLLSLNDFETIIEKSDLTISVLENKILINTRESESLLKSAEALVENIDRETKLKDNIDNQISSIKDRINSLVFNDSELNDKIEIFNKEKTSLVVDSSIDDKIKVLQTQLSTQKYLELEDLEKDFLREQNSLTKEIWSLKGQVDGCSKIEHQIAKLKENTCPTCKQTWLNAETELKSLELKLQDLNSKKNDLLELDSQNQEIINALKKIKNDILVSKQESRVLQEDLDKLKDRKRLDASKGQLIDKEIENLNNQKKNALKYFNLEKESLNNQIKQLEQTKINYSNNIELNTSKIKDLDIKLESFTWSTLALSTQINEEKEMFNSSKDFLRLITEETLKLISDESSKFVQKMPNAKSFYINFSTSKMNKNGKVKKEIVLQIFKNGKEVPFKRLSGGESCSVHLAIDLAVSKILASRTGKVLGWHVLDECLDGMKLENKIEALNILKEIATNKLILMTEHTSEIGEIFNKIIYVDKKTTGSEVSYIES